MERRCGRRVPRIELVGESLLRLMLDNCCASMRGDISRASDPARGHPPLRLKAPGGLNEVNADTANRG